MMEQMIQYIKHSFLLSLLALFTTASVTNSQCPPACTFTGEAEGDYFGYSVASAGDVNSDGFDDLIVGAYANDAGGYEAGRAYVFSGQTGDMTYTFTGEAANDHFGISVASAGDVNSDGFDDLIVGSPHNDAGGLNAGRAYVYSGQTGDMIYAFTGEAAGDYFGYSVASAGDVNGDGFDDLIVGAYRNDAGGYWAGRAYVFSGQTGDTIYIFAGAAGDHFGYSVASAGDVNSDSFADLIVGAHGNDAGGNNAGRAYVFSGQTGDTIYAFTGEAAYDRFGYSVASVGDANSDGFDDIIVGAYGNDAGGYNAGQAYIFSGQTGALLYTFTGEATGDWFGVSVASAGEVNGDGFADLIVGAPWNDAGDTNAGRAYVFSGQTGDTIYTFTSEVANEGFGYQVSSAGDMNGDGFADLFVGAPWNDASSEHTGWAHVFSGRGCICGDANGDSLVTMDDVVFLQAYYFECSTAPFPWLTSDLNCDGSVDIADIVYLAQFLNGTGPEPCCW
jgi:hypothetical protein